MTDFDTLKNNARAKQPMPAPTSPSAPQSAPAPLLVPEVTQPPTLGEEVIRDRIHFPPSDLESHEPPLETDLHRDQIDLLIRLLRWWWREGQSAPPLNYRPDYYVSGNTTIYYSPKQQKTEDFRGPDFFVVLGTANRPRKSWVVWEEAGKYPHVIIELLSASTANVDRGEKKRLYQDTFRTPEYFWFDPYSLEFEGFYLVDGTYQAIAATEQGWRWSQQLGLYLGIHQQQLRFFTSAGQLVPTPEEQNAKMAAKLRELGIDPDQI